MGRLARNRSCCVVAPDDSKGNFAYAKYHLEVGTLDASADRNARSAIWGEVEKGMQCGIRISEPAAQLQDRRHARGGSPLAKHQRGGHLDFTTEAA
jgi:hypothetical protein